MPLQNRNFKFVYLDLQTNCKINLMPRFVLEYNSKRDSILQQFLKKTLQRLYSFLI